jgi:hypothetical protein
VSSVIQTPQLDRGEHANSRARPMSAFALVIVAVNGLALSGLYVLTTNERLVQMVGAFAVSLLFLIRGAWRIRAMPGAATGLDTSGITRAAATSVAAGVLIVASGFVGSRWIGPTDAEFIRQESTRSAAAAWCGDPAAGGHIVGDVCRRHGEDLWRLPPKPIDWTRDEEGG